MSAAKGKSDEVLVYVDLMVMVHAGNGCYE